MSNLKSKYEDYMQIVNCGMRYELESGTIFSFKFEKDAFPHLVGLHKLKDISLIRRFNDPKEKMVSAVIQKL